MRQARGAGPDEMLDRLAGVAVIGAEPRQRREAAVAEDEARLGREDRDRLVHAVEHGLKRVAFGALVAAGGDRREISSNRKATAPSGCGWPVTR